MNSLQLSLPLRAAIRVIESALEEDLGRAGDLTSDSLLPAAQRDAGEIVAREEGRVCGLEGARLAFERLDPEAAWTALAADGDDVEAGTVLARIEGRTRALLAAERTALNLVGRLSGISTATRELVRKVEGSGARVIDTRKTTPGLRALEKYAVRVGGGGNHRFALDDAVLIKDNHLAAVGSVAAAIERVRSAVGHTVTIEVEVDDLEQLEEVIAAGGDAVLLDNMAPEILREAVERVAGRMVTEASGGVNSETIAAIAASGVDLISVGALTHSSPSFDVGFDLVPR